MFKNESITISWCLLKFAIANLAVVATASCARGDGGVNLREPEVRDFCRPGRVEEDVEAFQVAVDDAVYVQEAQALCTCG